MKQTITINQFQELTKEAQEKARGILPKQIGSRVFATLNLENPTLAKYNGIYIGVVVEVKENKYQVVYEKTGTTGPIKYLKEVANYPLFSLGELLQIVHENKPNGLLGMMVDVDDLWEEVKQIIER